MGSKTGVCLILSWFCLAVAFVCFLSGRLGDAFLGGFAKGVEISWNLPLGSLPWPTSLGLGFLFLGLWLMLSLTAIPVAIVESRRRYQEDSEI